MWLLSGVFLGWSLGQNDAANVIGPPVATRMLRVRTAILLAALFAILGAVLEGRAGIETYAALTPLTLRDAVVASLGTALTVTLFSVLGLPVSSSQAMVGAILTVGMLQGDVSVSGFTKVVACWLGTPVGAALIALALYSGLAVVHNRWCRNLFQADAALRVALALAGAYGAYALGANNVANVMGVFVGAGAVDMRTAVWLGGASIAAGIVTCSRGVIQTVGEKLVRLNAFAAFVVLLAEAVTVHIYTVLGVPVSTTQAVVGGVLGVGFARGSRTVHPRTLAGIVTGWLLTPASGAALTYLVHVLSRVWR